MHEWHSSATDATRYNTSDARISTDSKQ